MDPATFPYPPPIRPHALPSPLGTPSEDDTDSVGSGTRTPTNDPVLVVPDTPTLLKAALQPEAYDNLSKERVMTMDEIGSYIKQVPLKDFITDFLPLLDQRIDLDKILSRLRSGSNPILKVQGWNELPLNPIDSAVDEDSTYKPIKSIVSAILAAGASHSKRKSVLKYSQWPRKNVKHTFYDNPGKPDGHGYLPDPAHPRLQKVYWHQLIFSAQFKKSDVQEEVNKNTVQICNDLAQIMRDDPARRFTYGYTIENRSTKLWYCDRSELVVSQSFDFMTDPKWFIHFVLSLAFPRSESLWDIGVDTSMTRVADGKYDISVNDPVRGKIVYRTESCLHHFQAEAPRGRCTRVWKAREKKADGTEGSVVALKDTWIDHDRDREGDIIEAVIKDAPDDAKESLKTVLLTVLCHGDVLGPNEEEDSTRIVRDYELYALHGGTTYDRNGCARGYARRTQNGSYVDMPSTKHLAVPTFFDRRTHYRIVFKEVGTPLHQMDNLRKVFKALHRVSQGLYLMHLSGWVHRDISAHNIIWYKSPLDGKEYGILCDLEYAKRENQNKSHIVRSGSNFFVARDVTEYSYGTVSVHKLIGLRFTAVDPATLVDQIRDDLALPSSQSTTASEAFAEPDREDIDAPEAAATPFFRHCAPHDLESLWWVAVYIIFYREVYVADTFFDGTNTLQRAEPLRAQQDTAVYLFHTFRTPDTTSHGAYRSQAHHSKRDQAFRADGVFKRHVETLLPLTVRKAGLAMDVVRQTILRAHEMMSTKPDRILSAAEKAEVHAVIINSFREAYRNEDMKKSLSLRPHVELETMFRPVPHSDASGDTAATITNLLQDNQILTATTQRTDNLDDPRATKKRKT